VNYRRFIAGAALTTILLGAALTHHLYRREAERIRITGEPMPQLVARVLSLGLGSAGASFLWIQNISELPSLSIGADNFFANFDLITSLDAKLSFPYAYTVIALPLARKYPARIEKTFEIGRRGVALADPDWRIPFYLAATYQLERADFENAVKFYDITARTPGVPEPIQKFAENFGASPKLREETKRVWAAIYHSTNDKLLRDRAKKYVERLFLFDYLEKAARAYKERFGIYPRMPEEMAKRGVISEVPSDPLGFEIYITSDGFVTLNKPF
jgi:hypothetical protein